VVKHTAPPERLGQKHEDDAELAGQLCIRFMERTVEGIMASPELSPHYNTLFELLSAVVQDELKNYAFEFAYELYSDEWVIRRRRLAFEQEAAQEDTPP
jgi:hypothetical protein